MGRCISAIGSIYIIVIDTVRFTCMHYRYHFSGSERGKRLALFIFGVAANGHENSASLTPVWTKSPEPEPNKQGQGRGIGPRCTRNLDTIRLQTATYLVRDIHAAFLFWLHVVADVLSAEHGSRFGSTAVDRCRQGHVRPQAVHRWRTRNTSIKGCKQRDMHPIVSIY